jgi:hypothetical protein
LDRLVRTRTFDLNELMAIEVHMCPFGVQQTCAGVQAEVGTLSAERATIYRSNAALLPATLDWVFAESR